MKYNIHGRNIEVTEGMKEHIMDKLGKIDKYFSNSNEIEAKVIIRMAGLDQIIEVSIPLKHYVIRAEERNEDLYAAIDMVIDKLDRQIKKNKDKMQSKFNRESIKMMSLEPTLEKQEVYQIKKYKKIEMKPMNSEEALMQMNLVDHDFFIYKDVDTNSINVVYKRKDGEYGLIETT